jgi:FkbM family methyltransferase
MSIREGMTRYYGNYGLGGVLAVCIYRLVGRPKEITVHPPGIQEPLHIRTQTSDESAYEQILLHSQYAFDLPFSPKTIVDAGANIGMASIYFAHTYPEAKVIAIEAEASNFAVLARNVRPFPTIIPIHAALWNRDGAICVSEPDPATGRNGKWGFVTREGAGVNVRAITMGTLMKEMRMQAIDVLKVDIEGAEKEVFEACDWMGDIRCLMIELHDRFKPGCNEAVNSAAQGFSKLQRGDTTLYLRAS